MLRKKLLLLSKLLESNILDFEKKYHRSLESALEISRGTPASPSASGDREHAVNQAAINKGRLEKLKELRDEINTSLSISSPSKVKPPSFVILDYEGGKKEFYVVQNTVSLHNMNLLSVDSLLGKAILGKKEGESFEALLDDRSVRGKVLRIE